MGQRPLIPLCLALMAGILAGARPALLPPPWPVIAIAAAAVVTGLATRARRRLAAAGAVVVAVSLGLAVIQPWIHPVRGVDDVTRHIGSGRQRISGTVVGLPRPGANRLTMVIEATARQHADTWMAAAGRIRITVSGKHLPVVEPGDPVVFTTRLKPIIGFRNPGGFDFARFMAYRGVWTRGWVSAEAFRIVERHNGMARGGRPPVTWRAAIGRWLSDHVGGDAGAVLQSLTIGDRRHLRSDLRAQFSRLGIGHLLAISGLHLGIVALAAFRAARWLGVWVPALVWRGWVDRAAAVATLPVLVGYAVMAGMSPSTQRALIMVAVVTVGLVAGRRHDPLSALSMAAITILLIHPPALFAISFQFSFAAVFGIIAGMALLRPPPGDPSPPPDDWRAVCGRWLKTSIAVSLLATWSTAPLGMVYFQQLSLVGWAANLVFIPLLGFVVVPAALGAAVLLALVPPLGALLMNVAAGLTAFSLRLVDAAASLPGIAVDTFVPTVPEILMYYGWTGGLLWWAGRRRRCMRIGHVPPADVARHLRPALAGILVAGILLVGMDGVYWMHRRFWHRDLRVTFLDVGQGAAAVVAFPGGGVMLVDGGGNAMPGAFDVGAGVVAPFLLRERIFTVDTMVLTHANSDHLNGLIHIAERFRVGACWTNGASATTAGYRRLMAVLSEKKVPRPDYRQLYGRHRFGPAVVQVLHPGPTFDGKTAVGSRNDHSIVMRVSMGGCALLLTGDITAPVEAALAATYGDALAVDVLQAPHHGSRSSSSAALIGAAAPTVVVIPAGWGNRFGFPHPSVLARYRRAGAVVWRVDTGGAVTAAIDAQGVRCRQAVR